MKDIEQFSTEHLLQELLLRIEKGDRKSHNSFRHPHKEITLRSGLILTPDRVVRSWDELYSGYEWSDDKIKGMLTVFDGEPCDEMVVCKDIEFFSTCEHHILPFFGRAHIAYIPDKDRVVGISKLARLLEIHSRRLQIQERICREVVKDLMKHLEPKGAVCVLEGVHFCMTARGVNKQGSTMVSAALDGVFKEDNKCRSEFYSLIGKG